MTTVICIQCDSENTVHDEVCRVCGAPLATEGFILCSNCGYRNDKNHEACARCGASLTGEASEKKQKTGSESEAPQHEAEEPVPQAEDTPKTTAPGWLDELRVEARVRADQDIFSMADWLEESASGLADATLPDWLLKDLGTEDLAEPPEEEFPAEDEPPQWLIEVERSAALRRGPEEDVSATPEVTHAPVLDEPAVEQTAIQQPSVAPGTRVGGPIEKAPSPAPDKGNERVSSGPFTGMRLINRVPENLRPLFESATDGRSQQERLVIPSEKRTPTDWLRALQEDDIDLDELLESRQVTEEEVTELPVEVVSEIPDKDIAEAVPSWISEVLPIGEMTDEELAESLEKISSEDTAADVGTVEEVRIPTKPLPTTDSLKGVPELLASTELPDWLDEQLETLHENFARPHEEEGEEPDWLRTVDRSEIDRSAAEAWLENLHEFDEPGISDVEFPELEENGEVTGGLKSEALKDWFEDVHDGINHQYLGRSSNYVIDAGPLRGLSGAIPIAPNVSLMPIAPDPRQKPLWLSEEQKRQVAILERLMTDGSADEFDSGRTPVRRLNTRLILIIFAIIVMFILLAVLVSQIA